MNVYSKMCQFALLAAIVVVSGMSFPVLAKASKMVDSGIVALPEGSDFDQDNRAANGKTDEEASSDDKEAADREANYLISNEGNDAETGGMEDGFADLDGHWL